MSIYTKMTANFTATVNELVNRASGNPSYTPTIVDEKTFIDFGKTLANMGNADADRFKNAFAAEIANKVQISLNTARSYEGGLKSLIRGQATPNAVIEIITNLFMETRTADFVDPIDDNHNQWLVNKGAQSVKYYTQDNAYSIAVTIQDTELAGAFESPAAMANFLQGKITYALNTNEEARENGRRSILGALIRDLNGETAASTVETPAQKYKLVKLYNDMYDESLTADDCLYNGEFIRFAVNMIKKVSKKMAKPSYSYNKSGIKTFTPDNTEDRKLMVLGALDAGFTSYVHADVRRPENLGDYEVVDFWQSETDPFVVKGIDADAIVNAKTDVTSPTNNMVIYEVSTGKHLKYATASSTWSELSTADETSSAPVIAVLFDKYACGEYVCHEAVHTTPFNARLETYNNWINVQTKYFVNQDANAVIFTLEAE